jgi:hypothetical protein
MVERPGKPPNLVAPMPAITHLPERLLAIRFIL